jgi:hypothetical protein
VADTKISALSAVAAAATTNELAVNEAGTSKKVTLAQVETLLKARGMPRVAQLTSQHSIASTTGTKVTGLDMTLEAGTYYFTYALVIRQATNTADAPQFGVNFTGTTTKRNFHLRFADATTAVTAAIHSMDDVGIKTAGFIDGMAHNAFSTTAPNMGTTIGVAATASDILCFIEGLMIVTVSGNLELWRASETAAASTTEVGSSLIVIRTA